MPRNRKAKSQAAPPSAADQTTEISEDEQWRLIQESGVLQKISQSDASKGNIDTEDPSADVDGRPPLADEIFSAVILLIPFSFFLLLMDILIHQQYAKRPSAGEFAEHLINSVPILFIFIFYSQSICCLAPARYKANTRMQIALFLLSLGVGPRMIWLINRGSWLVNMRQCPRFATIWLYTVVQLDLAPAVLSLAMIGGWSWWAGMKLIL
ncbi:hypothetical protein BV22DRAFT_1017229 [Leucogyrophana mollusca]|uniref:Uncharacterized protein n=1 Tax=Leucogyrophana mollusca TaxID=85980 RepID=A0ACB8BCE2_9AGAM|nr:hypothetical protein BV22DRAFT_1017229 [Leucogyrophana mollusca]